MKLDEGKAIAGQGGIIYLMKATSSTATAEENGGVIIIPASATTTDIATPADKLPEGYTITESGTTQPTDIKEKIAANKGLLGSGTAEDPFQVYDKESFQAITMMYDAGYNYFKVNLERTSNGVIDCTGWSSIKLNGSFDGNGVVLNNIDSKLFRFIGYQPGTAAEAAKLSSWSTKDVVVENFEARFNYDGDMDTAAGMAYEVCGNNTTTFKNVTISGNISGGSNSGAFFTYTGPNYFDTYVEGMNQVINLENCLVTAKLTCTSGTFGAIAGFPTYMNAVTINCDKKLSELYKGDGLTTTGDIKFFAIQKNGDYNMTFNGSEITLSSSIIASVSCKNLTATNPTKETSGYEASWASNASRMEVYIAAQLDETDSNGEKTKVVGITMSCGHIATINKGTNASEKVLGLFSSVELKNKQEDYSAVLESGKLTISTGGKSNFTCGTIKLTVVQYDANGDMVGCGTIKIATKDGASGSWIIK